MDGKIVKINYHICKKMKCFLVKIIKTVQLGELGSFQLTIKSKDVENESNVTASLVEKVNLRFAPSIEMKNNLKRAQFRVK